MDAPLERLSAVYYALAVLVVLLPSRRARALGGVGVALIGLAAAADAIGNPASGSQFTTINEMLGLAGIAVAAGALLRDLWRRSVPGEPDPAARGLPRRSSPSDLLLLAGLVVAALAPHLLVLGLGAALALVSAARAAIRAARPAALIPLVASAASLGFGFGLLLTVLGPEGGEVARLRDGPVSLAAERLLTLLIGGGALLLAGLPPLHRVPWGRGLSPLSAILLLRLVAAGFPAGLLTWQVAATLLLTASFAWSVLRGHWTEAAVAGGLLAMWSGAGGSFAGAVLVAWGWLVETVGAIAERRGVTLAARWRGIAVLPVVLAALPALRAGLAAQVLLSVATAGACIASLFLEGKRGPRALHASLY